MTAQHAPSIEERLPAMAAVIHQAIPGCEVRLFGSRACGDSGPDSDIDLLITAPDSWLQNHHRYEVLNALWDRRHWRSHVIGRAYREGVSGAWVFCGIWIPLVALFQNLADGSSLGEFVEIFPGVTAEQVRLVLGHAAQCSQGPGLPEPRAAAETAGQRPASSMISSSP